MALFIKADQPNVDNDGDGYTESGGDCNDFDAAIHPGATEICGDGIDQDCNGLDLPCYTVNIDNDFDGFTTDGTGVAPNFLTGVDCDDNDPLVYPGANEICGDNIDQNCDGVDTACAGGDIDADGDGYTANMGDCNDADSGIYPGAYDFPFNDINEDCFDGVRPLSDELACVEIADVPLEVQLNAANANIMFLLDDSGSMDWEFMTEEEDGLFSGNYYPWDNSGDNSYTGGNNSTFNHVERQQWKSQWHGYNKIFYNPGVTYTPWPAAHELLGYGDADGNAPLDIVLSDPALGNFKFDLNKNPYLTLSSEGVMVALTREADGSSSTCADAIKLVKVGGATAGDVFIVDNDSKKGFEISGEWYESSGYYGWDIGTDSFSAGQYESLWTENEGNLAKWKFNLSEPGTYEVFACWTTAGTRTQSAPYEIYDNLGWKGTVRVNQQQDSGHWNTLGTFELSLATTQERVVHRAHYYIQKDGQKYLVELDGAIRIYEFNDFNANEKVDFGEIPPADMPLDESEAKVRGVWPINADGSYRTYLEERQNFTNWFSYYRKRVLSSKAAVAKIIAGMKNVNVGLTTVNVTIPRADSVVERVTEDDDLTDTSKGKGKLLATLYKKFDAGGGTPLRRGLQAVGEYFDDTDTVSGDIGPSPYAPEEEGGACQQSFVIAMTDGYWNGSDPNPSVGDADNDSFPQTLADVAMHFYDTDLSALPDLVPTHGLDLNKRQHMVTFAVAFGVTGTLPDDYCSTTQPEECTWDKDPLSSPRHKIDDLLHATRNGRGDFISASNPEELIAALVAIMQEIEARIGSGASVAISSQELQTGTALYQGIYDTKDWTGDIKAYELVSVEEAEADSSLVVGALKSTPKWSAKAQLNSKDWNSRQIITWNGAGGVPFRKDVFDLATLTHLNANTDTAKAMVDYLRGDATHEQPDGLGFRSRGGKLGDIVHSAPLKKDGVIYVGANDGMLHAFDANTGDEIFAYIPRLVFKNLNKLATPNPGYSHTYFVDNSPYVGKVGTSDYLVGGLGKGGKGYFCLDVTNISNAELNANGMVKWEYPNPAIMPDPDNIYDPANPVDADWADLGYSFSRAFIFNSNAGVPIVVFGNGYDSYSKKAALFILNAETGQVLAKINTGAGGWGGDGIKDTADDQCNGLSTPVLIDDNLDGKVDYAYAGDLLGNLWKFDLTGNSANLWKVAYGSAADPQPLFVAKNREGHRQPITTQPDVMYHCRYKRYGQLVIFGTGRYLGNDDIGDNSVQTLYGIWDWAKAWEKAELDPSGKYLGEFTPSRQLSNLSSLGINATLLEQTQIYFGSFFGEDFGIISDNEINWFVPPAGTGNHVGWFFDYPGTGERTVRDVIIRDEVAVAISSIPATVPCSAGGYSYLMEVNACSGSRTLNAQFDANGDGLVDSRDLVDIGSSANSKNTSLSRKKVQGMPHAPAIAEIPGTDIEVKYFSNSDGSIITWKEKKIGLGMSSWRELDGK
ncbi:MAG: PilC/PilY family type IV pilus protein [Desulfobacteraceae bacterium]